MKTGFIGCWAFLSFILIGCNKRVETPADYIVFGDYYGMCAGSCAHYYKIEAGVLYKDALMEYPSTGAPSYQFNAYTAPYNSALLDLAAELPANMYNEPGVIGMPDAYDQGGLYIEVNTQGNITRWKIDKNKLDVPVYLHAVCDSVEHYLEALE
jgi:hypothetical protein